jgi:copper chaperone CopZ
MTTVEILFRFTAPPNESVAFALAGIRDVYGIRRVSLDPAARTVRVEFDATRLTTASVAKLIRTTGLEVAEELPLIPPVAEPEAAPAS